MPNSSAPILPPRNPRRHPVYDVASSVAEEQPLPPPLPPKPRSSNKTACNSPLNKASLNYYTGPNSTQRRPASCPLQSDNNDKQTPKQPRKSSRPTSRKRRRRRTPTDALLLGNRYQVGVSPTPQVLRSAETRSPASPLFCTEEEFHSTTPPARANQSNSFTCRCSHQFATVELPLDNRDGAHCLETNHSSHCLESPNSCFNMDPSTIACGEAFTHTKQVASSGIRAKLSKLKHMFTRGPHYKHHQVGSTPPPPPTRRAFSAHRRQTSDITKEDRQITVPRMYSPHHNQSDSAKFSPVHLRTNSVPTRPTNAQPTTNSDYTHKSTNVHSNRSHDMTSHSRTFSGQSQPGANSACSPSFNGTQSWRPHSSRGRSSSRNRSQPKSTEETRQSPLRVEPSNSDQLSNSVRYTGEMDTTRLASRYDEINHNQARLENRNLATFLDNINVLQKMGYYWGSITFEEAEILLKDRKDGTFLVRDSSHEFYFLTLSFRAFNTTFHTRIEYSAGQFGFHSLPGDKAGTIVDFIFQAVERCENGRFHYFLQNSGSGPPTDPPAIPVSILYPMSRFTVVNSLQQLCRASILRHVRRRDLIEELPLPNSLKHYLLEKPYSRESLARFVEQTKDLQPLTLTTGTLPDQFHHSVNL